MVHQSTYRNITIGVVIAAIILFVSVIIWNGGFGPSGERAARETATTFGKVMRQVSLLAPDAPGQMTSLYGSLVTPQLLAAWQKNPKSAPGRLTSSPYPDRIDIKAATRQGSGYIVNGEVVYVSSTGETTRDPVIMQIIPTADTWLIAAYQEQVAARK